MVMIEDFEGDSAAVALGRLIVREGLEAPSVRAIAVETNMSPSGMLKRFDDKKHLLARASRAFAARFKSELQEQAAYRRWAGFIPEDERELFWIRVLCAWQELGRADEAIAWAMARLRDEIAAEIDYVGRRRNPAISGDDVVRCTVMILGIWSRMVDLAQPLDAATALNLWSGALAEAA